MARLNSLASIYRLKVWTRQPTGMRRPFDAAISRFTKQPQSRYHSGPEILHSPRSEKQSISFQTVAAASLAGLCCSIYFCSSNVPLSLESGSLAQPKRNDDGFRSKNGRSVMPFDMEQVNALLRWEEVSDTTGDGTGVLRTDAVRVPSNLPCEDEYFHRSRGFRYDSSTYTTGNLEWMMWGVFDGHVGSETALAVRQWIVSYLIDEFNQAATGLTEGASFLTDAPSFVVDRAIKDAFVRLDRDIIETGREAAMGKRYLNDAISELGACYAGSCALVSIYDKGSQQLRVACVGDSRAVLGRRNPAGEWEAIALSVDQTGFNPDEVERLRLEHPDEPDAVQNGRVLGMAITRAFGDARWKWPREIQEAAQNRFFGRRPLAGSRTPPYLTAEPIVTTTKIHPENGDFVIMATDGLWDSLTSEQAVDLVGRWLQTHNPAKRIKRLEYDLNATPNPSQRPERGDPAEKISYSSLPQSSSANFVVKDENAATHLARNALGGGDEDRLCGVMTAPPSFSRDLRDDITVQVIFFGNSKKDASTIQNY